MSVSDRKTSALLPYSALIPLCRHIFVICLNTSYDVSMLGYPILKSIIGHAQNHTTTPICVDDILTRCDGIAAQGPL